jgi:hypothetical protein
MIKKMIIVKYKIKISMIIPTPVNV